MGENTGEGRKTIKALQVSRSNNKISIAANNYTRGNDGATVGDTIFINPNVTQNELPGVLAHEGTHLLWGQRGFNYGLHGLTEERAAWSADYMVNLELTPKGAVNPSNERLEEMYPLLSW